MVKYERPLRPDQILSAVILAGGASSRMGRDKAWLKWHGKTLIDRAIHTVRQLGVREIFISGRPGQDYAALKCRVLYDLELGFGPMGGIERGLCECTTPLLLVLAVDMPQMTTSFLHQLLARCDRLTGAVPKLDAQLEPLAAIYPRRCHVLAAVAIARSQRAARDFALAARREHAVRTFPVTAWCEKYFANFNSLKDFASAASRTTRVSAP